MNYKYYRDLKHNYLVVKNENNNEEGGGYQLKIIESGKVEGLITCNVRNVNGEQFLYYEIGSMQSLRDRYASRGMNKAQQLQLFTDMKEMLEGLSEYLLGEDGVVFDVDSIFVDLNTGRYSFMFCPFAENAGNFEGLCEQLLDMTSSEDEEAAGAIYNLCDYATTKGAMTLEGIEKLLKENSPVATTIAPERTEKKPVPESIPDIHDYEAMYNDGFEDEVEAEEQETTSFSNKGIKKADKKLGARVELILSLLFAILVGVVVYIRMNFYLTSVESLISILVMVISMVCGVICFGSGIKGYTAKGAAFIMKTMGREKPEEAGEEEYEEEEEEYDMGFSQEEEDTPFHTPIKITSSFNNPHQENETVVLDMDQENLGELSLYSRNMDKTIRIGFEKLPLTIGKMEGCVDRVLQDMSISRIHCRIFRDETNGKLAIVDLNSTNGTYKNGLKLSPQEKDYLDEGDEVRIGRICFDCR